MSSVSQNQLSGERNYGALGQEAASDRHPVDDLYKYIIDYARERPEVCAMWAFGAGFILGWRLKPW